jgi:KRAB domain-containing zinc finger protein
MKNSNSTNVVFVIRALAKKKILIAMYNLCMKTKPFKCDLCNYSAFRHKDLRGHIECVHENLKQHQCKICQKSFGLKNALKTHNERVHKNQKPFKCDFCDYSAFQHAQVRKHIDCVHEKIKQH